jgi:hypothetical protein
VCTQSQLQGAHLCARHIANEVGETISRDDFAPMAQQVVVGFFGT